MLRLKYSHRFFLKHIVLIFMGTLLLLSCKTDIEMVQALTEQEEVPSVVAMDIEILYTEQGIVKLKILAPESHYFQYAEEPYNEFPKGIVVYTFDDSLSVDSELTANYAIFYEEKELWKARHNVVAKNSKGEILNTELLFWDQKEKRIFTDDMVKFTSLDGVIFGQGFESDENFENWAIKKTSGIIYVDDD